MEEGWECSDVPFFQLDLARDRTRLRCNELLQVAHRVRGETFHADCIFLRTGRLAEVSAEFPDESVRRLDRGRGDFETCLYVRDDHSR